MQTSLFDFDDSPAINTAGVDGVISVRAIHTQGTGITTAKVIETIHTHFVIVQVLDFLNDKLSSPFQIVDTDIMFCLRPGESVSLLKSDFLSKYNEVEYPSKLKKFMQLI